MGRILLILGFLLVILGLAVNLGVPLGRFPGDLHVRRGNFSFFFPLTTSIIASILLTLLFTFLGRR